MTKILLYFFVAFIVIFAFDSVNFNALFKKNKVIQARIFIVLLAICFTYLITNFIYDFFIYSKII